MSERRHRKRDDEHDPQRSERDPKGRSKRAPRPRDDEPDGRETRLAETHSSSRSERQPSSRLSSPPPMKLTEQMMNMALGSDAPKNPSAPSEAMEHSLDKGPVVVKFNKEGKLVSIETSHRTRIPWRQDDGRQAGDIQGKSSLCLEDVTEGSETRAARPRDRVNASTHNWLDNVPHSPTRTDISFRDNSPFGSRVEGSLKDSRTEEKQQSSLHRRGENPDDPIKETKQRRRSHGKRDEYSGETGKRSSRRTYDDREPQHNTSNSQDDQDRYGKPTESRRETSRGGDKRRSSTEQARQRATERSYHDPAPRSTRNERYDDALSGSDNTVRPRAEPSRDSGNTSWRPGETDAERSRRHAERRRRESDVQAASTSTAGRLHDAQRGHHE